MASRQYYPADRVEVTPSGVQINFHDAHPKTDDTPGQRRHYLTSLPPDVVRAEYPSVSTVLGLLEKPGLQSASHKLGVEGAIELASDGSLPQDVDEAISRMVARELCYWQVWDRASDRGTLSHDEVVNLAAGKVPDIAGLPENIRGQVRGLCAWYADFRPKVMQQEFMVASILHEFVGRPDMLAEFEHPEFRGVGLVDFKTTEKFKRFKNGKIRPPYREHVLQVAAYDLASQECGYPAADFLLIVRVDSSGAYDVSRSWATGEDFLAVLNAYRQLKDLASRSKVAA